MLPDFLGPFLPAVLLLLGVLLHFVSRWDEYAHKHGALGPRAYAKLEARRWYAAGIATVAMLLAFDQVAPLLGLDPKAPGASFLAGYFASSFAAKLGARVPKLPGA